MGNLNDLSPHKNKVELELVNSLHHKQNNGGSPIKKKAKLGNSNLNFPLDNQEITLNFERQI